jgi:hypothetical protein
MGRFLASGLLACAASLIDGSAIAGGALAGRGSYVSREDWMEK